MMRPLDEANSFARFTLLAGDPSVRTSRLGMESPTLTQAGRVEWKALAREAEMDGLAARVKGRREDLKAIVARTSNSTMAVGITDSSRSRISKRLREVGTVYLWR